MSLMFYLFFNCSEEDCLSDLTSEFLDLEYPMPWTNDRTSPSHLQAHRGQVTVLLLGDGDPLEGVGIPGSGDGWESSSAPGVLGVPGPPIKAACGGPAQTHHQPQDTPPLGVGKGPSVFWDHSGTRYSRHGALWHCPALQLTPRGSWKLHCWIFGS